MTSKGKYADSLVALYYLKAQFEPLRSHETLQEGASSVRCNSPLVLHCYNNNPIVFGLKSRLSRPKLLQSLQKTLKHVLLNVLLVPAQHDTVRVTQEEVQTRPTRTKRRPARLDD